MSNISNIEWLRADLGAARDMLRSACAFRDPLAIMQYKCRIEAIEADLEVALNEKSETATATIFFGGRPLIGSRGVDIFFASKALELFQRVLLAQCAGDPSAVRDSALLMVTGFDRSSMSFQLEAEAAPGMTATGLADALDRLTQTLAQCVGPGDEWRATLSQVDERLYSMLQEWFVFLDSADASVRIIQRMRDCALSREDVALARDRLSRASR